MMGCSVKAGSEREEREEARKHKEWLEARRKEEREGTSEALVKTVYSVCVDGQERKEFSAEYDPHYPRYDYDHEKKSSQAKDEAMIYAMKLREGGETKEIKVIEHSIYETRTRETNDYLVVNIPAGNKFPPADF